MKRLLLFCCLTCLCFVLCSCGSNFDELNINGYVKSLGKNELTEAKTETTVYQSVEEIAALDNKQDYKMDASNEESINGYLDEEIYYKYVKYQSTGGLDELTNYGQYDNILYPGALVNIANPSISIIPLEQSPITMSISLESVTDNSTYRPYVMNEPSLSNARMGVNKLVANTINRSNIPTRLSMSVKYADNSSDFKIALGINANTGSVKISEQFDYSSSNKSKSIILVLSQVYYTIDIDNKKSASNYFNSLLTTGQIREGLEGTIPAIVSSVSYGRIAIIKLTSNESMYSIENKLSGGYKGLVEASTDISQKIDNNQINSEIFVYGGHLSNDSTLGTSASLEDVVKEFNSQINPVGAVAAVPISYKLNYITDFSPAKIMMTNDPVYIKQACLKYSVLDLSLEKIALLNKDYEAWDLDKTTVEMNDLKINANYIIENSKGDIIPPDDERYQTGVLTNVGIISFSSGATSYDFSTGNQLRIAGIDNSHIVSTNLVSINLNVSFKVKTTSATFWSWLVGNKENNETLTYETSIRGYNKITDLNGFYVDLKVNQGYIRLYFSAETIY